MNSFRLLLRENRRIQKNSPPINRACSDTFLHLRLFEVNNRVNWGQKCLKYLYGLKKPLFCKVLWIFGQGKFFLKPTQTKVKSLNEFEFILAMLVSLAHVQRKYNLAWTFSNLFNHAVDAMLEKACYTATFFRGYISLLFCRPLDLPCTIPSPNQIMRVALSIRGIYPEWGICQNSLGELKSLLGFPYRVLIRQSLCSDQSVPLVV